ncbi:MAG: hypothetical protein NUV91_08540 [Candidatus Omnitrophica bacterium]|nr:hypothetical protein [Candidatus Omnitrophota bacterium]
MKKTTLLIFSLMMMGCASAGNVQKAYQAINLADGVDGWEAKTIAQKQLIDTEFQKQYYLNSGQVISTVLVHDYPDYWFVGFANKDFNQSFWEYLVVINKKDGEIKFAGPYVPLGVANFDWVFKPESQNWKVGDGA